MDAEVIGIDHVYLSVRSLDVSERFYDDLLAGVLGFRKNAFALGGEPHVQYDNRHFGFVIRPARDYYATFLADPDGMRLEITNFRAERKERIASWGDR